MNTERETVEQACREAEEAARIAFNILASLMADANASMAKASKAFQAFDGGGRTVPAVNILAGIYVQIDRARDAAERLLAAIRIADGCRTSVVLMERAETDA